MNSTKRITCITEKHQICENTIYLSITRVKPQVKTCQTPRLTKRGYLRGRLPGSKTEVVQQHSRACKEAEKFSWSSYCPVRSTALPCPQGQLVLLENRSKVSSQVICFASRVLQTVVPQEHSECWLAGLFKHDLELPISSNKHHSPKSPIARQEMLWSQNHELLWVSPAKAIGFSSCPGSNTEHTLPNSPITASSRGLAGCTQHSFSWQCYNASDFLHKCIQHEQSLGNIKTGSIFRQQMK